MIVFTNKKAILLYFHNPDLNWWTISADGRTAAGDSFEKEEEGWFTWF